MKYKLTIVMWLFAAHCFPQAASHYSVIIDEIMADPAPPVALPNVEYIELKNVSTQSINLAGWQIGDASSVASISKNFMLAPGAYVVLCSSTAAAQLSVYGPVIAVTSFPSLNNDGDQLFLRSKEGVTIHTVNYDIAWYHNPVKNQGGWSLEMIDTGNPCGTDNNWTASTDPAGGTPGKQNAVNGSNADTHAPSLLGAFATDSISIQLVFDESVDSTIVSRTASYQISNGIGKPASAIALPPAFNSIELKTTAPLTPNKIYYVDASNVADCAGNSTALHGIAAGRAIAAKPADLVINEILFNPHSGGSDYIEIFNRGAAIIDLQEIYLGNRSAGSISNLKQLSATHRLLFPGEYIVACADPDDIMTTFTVKDLRSLIMVTPMPSMSDDKGDLVILNAQGLPIDELAYDEHWQFPLLDSKEGVALERIDYNKPTQDASNWHSAATSAGYGTPGYQNSQFRADVQVQGSLSVSPHVFSPDNDGFDDFLTIQYQFPEPGYVCSLRVFDAGGHMIRDLVHNAICGSTGRFQWNGLGETNTKLPIGIYVILAEVFNLQGKTKKILLPVTLARRSG